MKTALCLLPLALLVLWCAVSCMSQAQHDAGRALAAEAAAATDPAGPGGAAVTPEEEQRLTALYQRLVDAAGINWEQVGAGLLASLAVVFPALRLLPSRFFLGTAPDPDVKRVAGLPT